MNQPTLKMTEMGEEDQGKKGGGRHTEFSMGWEASKKKGNETRITNQEREKECREHRKKGEEPNIQHGFPKGYTVFGHSKRALKLQCG